MGLTSIFLIQLPFVRSSHIFHYYDRWVVDANHFAGSTRFTDQNIEGRQPKRINGIPNRSHDLGIPSRTNALWPSFRPFCHAIQHTGARYTPE